MNVFQKQLLLRGEPMVERQRRGPSLVKGYETIDRREAELAGQPLAPVACSVEQFEADTPPQQKEVKAWV